MTPGHVEQWKWELTWGVMVPIISAVERMEWSRLGRVSFLSFTESALRTALQHKVQYRAKKIAAARKRRHITHLRNVQ